MEQYVEFYIGVLKKWNIFSGRARRKEYWMFFLMNFILFTILGVLIQFPYMGDVFYIISVLLSFALIIPNLALSIRRLHDTNHSGWLLLLGLIPLIGAIILLVFFIQGGTSGNNKYGPNPKA